VADGEVSLLYRLLGRDEASPAFHKASDGADRLHRSMTAVGIAIGSVAVGGVVALGAAMIQGVKDAQDYQTLALKTQAVLKSTGNAAGTSVKNIQGLASSLETMSGVDETLIINSQNVLATFTSIRNEAGKGNDIFNQGTKAALNLSTALGTDLQGSTIQVGKALNDPIKGVTALQRVGVSFTAAQKDQIAAMVKTGDTMGAQKLILGELNKEFGGAAKAAGGGFSGAIAHLKDVFGDAFRDLAIKYLPDLTRLAKWLADQAPGAIKTAEKAFADIQAAIKAAADIIIPLFNFIRDHSTIFGSLAVSIGTVVAVIKTWQAVTKAFTVVQAALDVVLTANPIGLVVVAIAALAAGLIYAYKNSETFRKAVDTSWDAIKTVVMTGVRLVVGYYLWFAGMIIDAAAAAFGWIPGIGPKLRSAQEAFHRFKDSVNASLAGINDKTVHVNIVTHAEEIKGKGGFHEGRASGGPVAAGVAYLVGEQGPEIVTFGSSGHVSTNSDSRRMLAGGAGGGDTHVHVHMQSGFVGSNDQLATAMSDVIQRAKSRGLDLGFA
jgi:phage-related minor tail protein